MSTAVFAVAVAVALVGSVGVHAAETKSAVSLSVDHISISAKLGRKFSFASTITNRGSTVASGLIAHLNVLSLRGGVYVDPEDWSSHRTRYLAPIPAGGSTTIMWKMEAVNAGTFGVYVAVLPQNGAARPPTTGPVIQVAVADRKSLDSGGILPLALGIPGLLGVGWVVVRHRRIKPQAILAVRR